MSYNNSHCGTGGNTGADSSVDCCENCGLTINPDGSALTAETSNRPPRLLRSYRCGGCRRHHHSFRPHAPSGHDRPHPPRPPFSSDQPGPFPGEHAPQPMYPVQQALLQGTLYPELNMPFAPIRSYPVTACASMQQLEAFTLWELRLYLDTHPDDHHALALFRRLCHQAREENYACAFLGDCLKDWDWPDDPWPWTYQQCSEEG